MLCGSLANFYEWDDGNGAKHGNESEEEGGNQDIVIRSEAMMMGKFEYALIPFGPSTYSLADPYDEAETLLLHSIRLSLP